MAASVNKAQILGHLGEDPKAVTFSSGDMKVAFSVATSESWKDDEGQKQERTQWHRVAVTNQGLAKIANEYLKKGSRVYVEGQMETRSYTDKENIKRQVTELVVPPYSGALVLLDPKPGE